ncbi:MAG: hypothetical protein M1449_02410 [Candidatus Thermoplasmatota archaeon]|nr:hypothetical protein [Candidatus Thermoplasmatota archaeon]
MRKTETEYRELRWRAKGTVGLIGLGAWIGAAGWLMHAGAADAAALLRLIELSAANIYFWAVIACSGALGGWVAMLIFWRGPAAVTSDEPGPGLSGFDGPKF